MDLKNITEYIESNGTNLDATSLTLSRPWCFLLYGQIDNQLSFERDAVHSRNQLIQGLPELSFNIYNTSKSLMLQYFKHLDLPQPYANAKSLENVYNIIESLNNKTISEVNQMVYLCLNIPFDYLTKYSDILDDDKIILLKTLVYTMYHCLESISNLIEDKFSWIGVSILFNDNDR